VTDTPGMFAAPGRHRRRSSRIGIIIVIMVIAALLLLGGAATWWLLYHSQTNVPGGEQVKVVIQPGETSEQIGRQLVFAGVVPNALMFRVQARLSPTRGQLKTGEYLFTTGSTYESVLKKLANGPEIIYYDVTIPEGFTVKQVAARFAARAKINYDELLALVTKGAREFVVGHPYLADAHDGSLEGYLFPKTYKVKEGTTSKQVVEMMLDQFDAETAGLDLTAAKKRGLSLPEVVTVASILQRETKLNKEFPLVSSVIYNRLAQKMRLQLDSTVFYIVPEGTTKLTSSDLANPSPYNTYRHAGLPPGPICSPGLSALRAAAHPATTKYLYYVLTGKDGSQTFTTNYQDFLVAVRKYKKVFGK
jgi:UPF0755 protein